MLNKIVLAAVFSMSVAGYAWAMCGSSSSSSLQLNSAASSTSSSRQGSTVSLLDLSSIAVDLRDSAALEACGGDDFAGTNNFHIVAPGYVYRSKEMSMAYLTAVIANFGIKLVIDLREECALVRREREAISKIRTAGCSYAVLNWKPSNARVSAENQSKLDELRALLVPKNYPILIHCALGELRTGAACCAVKLWLGSSLDEALEQLSAGLGGGAADDETVKVWRAYGEELVRASREVALDDVVLAVDELTIDGE